MTAWNDLFEHIAPRVRNTEPEAHRHWRELPLSDAIAGLALKIRMHFAFEYGVGPDQADLLLNPMLSQEREEDRLEALLRMDNVMGVIDEMRQRNDPALPPELKG